MARRSAPPRASVLIIAGGRGTRFWPASREANPKPLFSIDGKTSLLADTIARHVPLIPRERIFVLAAAAHQAPFRRALRGLIPAQNLIVEPLARGTAVAIAYGAAIIKRRLGDGDHRVRSRRITTSRPPSNIGARSPTRSVSPRRTNRSSRSGFRRRGPKPVTAIRRSAQRSAPDFESKNSSRSRRSQLRAGWCAAGATCGTPRCSWRRRGRWRGNSRAHCPALGSRGGKTRADAADETRARVRPAALRFVRPRDNGEERQRAQRARAIFMA